MPERHDIAELPRPVLAARFDELRRLEGIDDRGPERLGDIRKELAYLSFELRWRLQDAVV